MPQLTSDTNPNPADPLKLHPEDLPDIQGFIVHGYNMPKSRHFVLTIGQVSAALDFLNAITSGSGIMSVTSAARWPPGMKPEYALNIGLTAKGLEALQLPAASVNFDAGNFSSFLGGAVAAAETVFDIGPNDPANWLTKLNKGNADLAHVVLSLYTFTPEARTEFSIKLRAMFAPVIPPAGAPGHDVLEWDVDPIIEVDPVNLEKYRIIHFGYTDGISEPVIDEIGLPPLRPKQLPYVAAWQFVLRDGSMTSYNLPTPWQLGQNGTFSAFRILEQNVPAFEAFLTADGRDKDAQELLASKLCGRWRNGNPLVVRPDAPGARLSDNEMKDFDYGTDNIGEPCPFSAHTRRSNSRGGPLVVKVGDKVNHRIMRRADAYGPPYTGTDDGKERGLAGHFICSMLSNQFEFLMSQWVNSTTFAGGKALPGIDPLLGNVGDVPNVPNQNVFTYWENSQAVQVPNLSRFVTTRGGLYCFLPSITAIKWMAQNGGATDPWKIPATSF
jgi:deferrochelatase/peroxidase EfeB